jgi:hypothetical protein
LNVNNERDYIKYLRLNASHIWVGGGFIPETVKKVSIHEDYSKEDTEIGKVNGTILNQTWFFDGSSWIPVNSMLEKRNKAACSIVFDLNGEVSYYF